MASKTYGNQVWGLRDIKITNIGGTVQEDLGAAVTLSCVPTIVNGMLEGDDVVKGVVAGFSHAEWELSAGEYSEAAIEILTGISLSTSGSTPNEIHTLKVDEATRLPYFKIYGQAYDESTGDFQILMAKCKCTKLEAYTLENGEWRISEIGGIAIDDGSNGIFKSVQHETAAAVPAS